MPVIQLSEIVCGLFRWARYRNFQRLSSGITGYFPRLTPLKITVMQPWWLPLFQSGCGKTATAPSGRLPCSESHTWRRVPREHLPQLYDSTPMPTNFTQAQLWRDVLQSSARIFYTLLQYQNDPNFSFFHTLSFSSLFVGSCDSCRHWISSFHIIWISRMIFLTFYWKSVKSVSLSNLQIHL